MKLRYFACSMLLVVQMQQVYAVEAETPAQPMQVQQQMPHQLLQQIGMQLEQAPVLRGEFTQSKTLQGFKQPLLSSGTFVVAQRKGIVWQVQQPFASTLLVKPDRLQSKHSDGSLGFEVQAAQEPAIQAINAMLFAVMSADVKVLPQHFEISGQVKASGWYMTLSPRDKVLSQWLRTIELRGAKFVEHVHLQEAQGEISEISLKNFKVLQDLSGQDAHLFD